MMSEIVQFILEIIIIIIGLYLAFFKSYFKEKGKQLAIKEDIEEITNKVKKIRTDFIKDIEKLKTELQVSSSSQISFNSEKRNYILDYFAKYSVWKTAVFAILPSNVSENIKHQDIAKTLNTYYLDFRIISSKMELFINDVIFKDLDTKLTVLIINYQSIVEQYLIKGDLNIYWKKQIDNESSDEIKITKIKELTAEMVELINELGDIRVENLNGLILHEQKMLVYLRERLKYIAEES